MMFRCGLVAIPVARECTASAVSSNVVQRSTSSTGSGEACNDDVDGQCCSRLSEIG